MAEFFTMDAHRDEPAPPAPGGKLVLSRLPRGDTPITAAATSIKFVLDGEERYEFEDARITVKAGQFAVVEAGTRLRAVLPRRETTLGLCVYLPVPESSGALHPLLSPAHVFSAAGLPLGETLGAAARGLQKRPVMEPPEARRLLARLRAELSALAGDTGARLEQMSAARPSTRRELLRRVDRARALLHERRDEPVRLAELSRAAGLSPFHLARAFKETYGRAPGEYHAELRLGAAADLLRGGACASEAAARLGYSEPSAFARAFKRRYGVPPGAFRRAG